MSRLDDTLKGFSRGSADVRQLVECLALERPTVDELQTNLRGDFSVEVAHIAKLVEAAIDGTLPLDSLCPVALRLVTSGKFTWNDMLVSEMVRQLAVPAAQSTVKLKAALDVLNRRLGAKSPG